MECIFWGASKFLAVSNTSVPQNVKKYAFFLSFEISVYLFANKKHSNLSRYMFHISVAGLKVAKEGIAAIFVGDRHFSSQNFWIVVR